MQSMWYTTGPSTVLSESLGDVLTAPYKHPAYGDTQFEFGPSAETWQTLVGDSSRAGRLGFETDLKSHFYEGDYMVTSLADTKPLLTKDTSLPHSTADYLQPSESSVQSEPWNHSDPMGVAVPAPVRCKYEAAESPMAQQVTHHQSMASECVSPLRFGTDGSQREHWQATAPQTLSQGIGFCSDLHTKPTDIQFDGRSSYGLDGCPSLNGGAHFNQGPSCNQLAVSNDFLRPQFEGHNFGGDAPSQSGDGDSLKSPLSQQTMTSIRDHSRDRDRRPYFHDGSWWWQPDNGPVTRGLCRPAPKKKDRLILEFVGPGGKKLKKYYRCEICFAERNRTEWVFHKNYVHQHIPRHHKEQCEFCSHCNQSIYKEIYGIHIKNCSGRVLKSNASTGNSQCRGKRSTPRLKPDPGLKKTQLRGHFSSSPFESDTVTASDSETAFGGPQHAALLQDSYCSATGEWWDPQAISESSSPTSVPSSGRLSGAGAAVDQFPESIVQSQNVRGNSENVPSTEMSDGDLLYSRGAYSGLQCHEPSSVCGPYLKGEHSPPRSRLPGTDFTPTNGSCGYLIKVEPPDGALTPPVLPLHPVVHRSTAQMVPSPPRSPNEVLSSNRSSLSDAFNTAQCTSTSEANTAPSSTSDPTELHSNELWVDCPQPILSFHNDVDSDYLRHSYPADPFLTDGIDHTNELHSQERSPEMSWASIAAFPQTHSRSMSDVYDGGNCIYADPYGSMAPINYDLMADTITACDPLASLYSSHPMVLHGTEYPPAYMG